MEFFVLRYDARTFDIFEGKQYCEASWTRLKAGKMGVYIQKGQKLPHHITKTIASKIDPSLNHQFIII